MSLWRWWRPALLAPQLPGPMGLCLVDTGMEWGLVAPDGGSDPALRPGSATFTLGPSECSFCSLASVSPPVKWTEFLLSVMCATVLSIPSIYRVTYPQFIKAFSEY